MNVERAKERLDKTQIEGVLTYAGISIEEFSKPHLLKITAIAMQELIRERALYSEKAARHFSQEILDLIRGT